MERQLLLFAILALFVVSCKQKNTSVQQHIEEITPRNTGINPGNAYNDLFLDTSAVEKFITRQKLDDTTGNRLRSFYNSRNFQFAWFDSKGLNEQAYGFRSVYDYSKDTSEPNKSLEYRLNALMTGESDSISPRDANIIKTELQLTQRFIEYFRKTYPDAEIRQLEHFIPMQKEELFKKAEEAIRNKKDIFSSNTTYSTLVKFLEQYTSIAKKGGWDSIPVEKKKYRKGDSTLLVARVKQRLHMTGEYPDNDTSAVFNDNLENAVKTFEATYGHVPEGAITDTIIRELNIPAIQIVQCLLVNMERMHWLPVSPEGRLIRVNIPEFMLHAWNGGNKDFDMPVVVGKEGKGTTMFSGELDQIVFSPYWNLPNSIVREEILPALARNPHYLQEKNMEVTGERNGLPIIRQLPGKDNPLGRVKFLFPNSFNIYFHDTNQKYLFNKEQRAFSHGCIRLGDPVRMTRYLLADAPSWTPERIDSAMNSGKEKYVRIKSPVPVIITYFTAWVDEAGHLQLRRDIYDHDSTMAAKLFTR